MAARGRTAAGDGARQPDPWSVAERAGALIANHLAERSSVCSVLANPGVVPKVQAEHNVRIPDLAVICSKYEAEEPVIADPMLIVEIPSPSNEAETWANVWAYATIPSVREIVVLRTVSIGADLLRRRADGSWPRTPEAIEVGDLVLESIGFRAPLIALYRTTRLAGRSGAAGG
ncbi:MAG: Uma2 family endonuclease [Methylocella sp.]